MNIISLKHIRIIQRWFSYYFDDWYIDIDSKYYLAVYPKLNIQFFECTFDFKISKKCFLVFKIFNFCFILLIKITIKNSDFKTFSCNIYKWNNLTLRQKNEYLGICDKEAEGLGFIPHTPSWYKSTFWFCYWITKPFSSRSYVLQIR